METTTPKPSLKDILNQKVPSKEVDAAKDVTKTSRMVFGLMAQIEKITEATINEATKALKTEGTRKETQQAVQTAMALAISESKKEGWEAAAQAELLKDLREKIAGRTIARNRRAFQSYSEDEMGELIKQLVPWRTASRPEEIAFCSREMMPPGSSRLGRASHVKMRIGEFPQEVEEIIYTLVQFRLAAEKNCQPHLTATEAETLKAATVKLQNPRGGEVEIPEESKARAGTSPAATAEYLKIVTAVLEKLNPDEKSKASITREVELFASATEDVGTDLEALQGIQKEEFSAVRELEKQFNVLEAAATSETWKAPETKEETGLRIFQAIRNADPAMGRATTMNLTAQLLRDDEWVASFNEKGPDAVYEAKGFKNHVVLTEPENGLFGDVLKPDDYISEGRSLMEAVSLVDQAEQMLFTDPLLSAIATRDRESAFSCARRLLTTEVSEEEIAARPMLKKVNETRVLAETMSQAINKEIDGSERNLARLPMAMREREQRGRVDSALGRIILMLAEPETQTAIETLLEEEQTNLAQLQESQNPDQNEIRARIHCQEKIATLEAMLDVAKDNLEMEESTYENLLRVISVETIPKTLRDHAIVTLCDNKSANGLKVKTKDMLERIETVTGQKGFTAKIRGALGTLRRWKDREASPVTVSKTELAEAICASPKDLKKIMAPELKLALKSCLAAAPWKDPFAAGTKEISVCNREYLAAKAAYKDDPKTFYKLRALHAMTAEIVKGANGSGWMKGQKLAEALASKDPEGLRAKENAALQAALAAEDPRPAVAYLAAWYNAVGNEQAMLRGAVLDEQWEEERIPMAGAKMQTRIENLMEIAAYSKSVASNPDALAEAYIQHSLHEQRGGGERWDIRIDRMLAKNASEINRAKEELEDWTTKFNAVFDDVEDDELTEDEQTKKQATKAVCHRKIGQKEREVENLLMKGDRLRELKATTHAINGAASPKEMVEALEKDTDRRELMNLGTALDKAMALAASPGKLNLPVTGSVSPFQIMEGAAIEKSLERCKVLLRDAKKSLQEHQPTLEALEIDDDPREAARELKRAAYKTLKDVELHLWESGKSIDLAEEELEAFIKENPELIANRKDWVETLKKTQVDLASSVEVAANGPQKPKNKRRKEKTNLEEPAQEIAA
jgi:hypothetical protein